MQFVKCMILKAGVIMVSPPVLNPLTQHEVYIQNLLEFVPMEPVLGMKSWALPIMLHYVLQNP